ncbi:unnamed protein product [Calypogeia fissa]
MIDVAIQTQKAARQGSTTLIRHTARQEVSPRIRLTFEDFPPSLEEEERRRRRTREEFIWLLNIWRTSRIFKCLFGRRVCSCCCIDYCSVDHKGLALYSIAHNREGGRKGGKGERNRFSRSALTAVDQTEMEFMSLGSVSNPPAEERDWVTNLRLGMSARERGKERAAMLTRRWG